MEMKHFVITSDSRVWELFSADKFTVDPDGYLHLWKNDEAVAVFPPGWQAVMQGVND